MNIFRCQYLESPRLEWWGGGDGHHRLRTNHIYREQRQRIVRRVKGGEEREGVRAELKETQDENRQEHCLYCILYYLVCDSPCPAFCVLAAAPLFSFAPIHIRHIDKEGNI